MSLEKDREIFDELRTLGKGVARIDERTERMDKEWRDSRSDHEARIRRLESDNDKRKGVAAIIGALAGLIVQGIFALFKHSAGVSGQ